MTREEFVSIFGGVFEHSAWIAERAFDQGLVGSTETAAAVHQALVTVFRDARSDEQLGVLRAHPDLAGKLAAAKKLTAESTSEQASAGLDMLTDAERKTFTDLNARYTKKFGHPFIIAVRDHEKASILAAFETRINHTPKDELDAACRQVERIAKLRLIEMLS